MNLFLWIFAGSTTSALTVLFFIDSYSAGVGNIAFGIAGALLAGLFSSKYLDLQPIAGNVKSFSPIGFVVSSLGAVIFLLFYNWILR